MSEHMTRAQSFRWSCSKGPKAYPIEGSPNQPQIKVDMRIGTVKSRPLSTPGMRLHEQVGTMRLLTFMLDLRTAKVTFQAAMCRERRPAALL